MECPPQGENIHRGKTLSEVLIGIQARSTSTRFPGKCWEMIGGKTVTEHVLAACRSAAYHTNRFTRGHGINVNVALLIPLGDNLGDEYRGRATVFEGDLNDVLNRYVSAVSETASDYVVRVTGDCPLIPATVINKCISIAVKGNLDYFSNVHDKLRTAPDGWDCEVISKRLMEWLDENSKLPEEREHVTLRARTNPPDWARRGINIGHIDLSHIKISVDTPEDLSWVRKEHDRLNKLALRAMEEYGFKSVHRF
jgi:spore coat polysaccharide biosynthesis protein SpsF (cytidylyltransferase family)